MQTLLLIVGAYILYKVVTDFIIPIYRTTKRVQEQFRTMQETARNNNMQSTANPYTAPPENKAYTSAPKENAKEYIDFEEIND